jgi:1-aminocyclopropane-1-carboxylate deaminase/D-cysteine desulfhydrase-like pyridoxal-dependent ACC family enzyme
VTVIAPPELQARLDGFPRARLGFFPTPLAPLPRLSAHLGGPPILMKREDHSGLALGGNKVRMLEFVLGDALAQGADVLIAGGGRSQSNHGRLCAAAARACGLDPIIILSEDPTVPGTTQANLLLQYLLGSDTRVVSADEIRPDAPPRFGLHHLMEAEADRQRSRGRRPYVLPTSSIPLATLGFVAAALELAAQLDELGAGHVHLVMTSTGATQAGLLLTATALGLPWTITGVACAPALHAAENVVRLANGAAELLDLETRIGREAVRTLDRSGRGYGHGDPASLAALHLVARLEAIFLDPVYTAKGMVGLFDVVRDEAAPADTIVFVHTGGTPTLFAYTEELASDRDGIRRAVAGDVMEVNG